MYFWVILGIFAILSFIYLIFNVFSRSDIDSFDPKSKALQKPFDADDPYVDPGLWERAELRNKHVKWPKYTRNF